MVGTLDPEDWETFGRTAHRVLDEALAFLRTSRERPVWTPVSEELKRAPGQPPLEGEDADSVCNEALRRILPFATGNVHPRFFGWVHGSGNAAGLLAEIIAATMNSNVGGRDHGAVYVERQVVAWCRQMIGLPQEASGMLVSGTSMATLIGLMVARNAHARLDVRCEGIGDVAGHLVGYASTAVHGSVARAFEILGLGRKALRLVPVDTDHRIDLAALRNFVATDLSSGRQPFCVIGTAGTVDTGAIDDLQGLAQICSQYGLWFHVDGAFGALAVLSDRLKPRLTGIERADSLAFDFHKWMHVPYDAGCVLVRRADLHREAFELHANYLSPAQRGLAAGKPWFCDFGPELSRGFRALKVWFTLKHYGTKRLGEAIDRNCEQARYLADRIRANRCLELLTPVSLNIVCFRFWRTELPDDELNRLNADIIADLQESGVAAPSKTEIDDRTAIRVCLTNHRTERSDLDFLLETVVAIGARRCGVRATRKVWTSDGSPCQDPRSPLTPPISCLDHPDFRSLLYQVRTTIESHLEQPFLVLSGYRVALGPQFLERPGRDRSPLLRHALELALWQRLAAARGGMTPIVDCLVCRVAALYRRSLSDRERHAGNASIPEWLLDAYELLGGEGPPSTADLLRDECLLLVSKLARLRGAAPSKSELRKLLDRRRDALESLLEFAAPLEHLLVTGGDRRLVLNPATGLNKYGCAPRPRRALLDLASSTASSISAEAYAAAEHLRQQLVEAALAGDREAAFAKAFEETKRRLAIASGVDGEPGIGVVLTPSGTDGELAALHVARAAEEFVVNIVVAPDETGSGVPRAAQGRHYDSTTPWGAAVGPGDPIEGWRPEQIGLEVVELRDRDGHVRLPEAVDREVERHVEDAISGGARCLLHLIDCSKSGLRAPSLGLARRLRERHPTRLDVVVDACQMRLDPGRLRRYVQAGFMVLVTGSKFFGGPPFSGALLLPRMIARRDPRAALPTGLGQYFGRHEWPHEWAAARSTLDPRCNLGLLLRWEAALSEMAAFAAVPRSQRVEIMTRLAGEARDAIQTSRCLQLVPNGDWLDAEEPPTILAFRVLNVGENHAPFDFESTKRIYQWLSLDLSGWLPNSSLQHETALASTPCSVGQPIEMGQDVGALRICIGARLVCEVAFSPDLGEAYELRLRNQIDRMRLVVAKTELIAQHFERLAYCASDGRKAGSNARGDHSLISDANNWASHPQLGTNS